MQVLRVPSDMPNKLFYATVLPTCSSELGLKRLGARIKPVVNDVLVVRLSTDKNTELEILRAHVNVYTYLNNGRRFRIAYKNEVKKCKS